MKIVFLLVSAIPHTVCKNANRCCVRHVHELINCVIASFIAVLKFSSDDYYVYIGVQVLAASIILLGIEIVFIH